MKVTALKVNHLNHPIGFHMDHINLEWKIIQSMGVKVLWSQIIVGRDSDFSNILYDYKCNDISQNNIDIPIQLEPSKRYFWKIIVCDENNNLVESDVSFFETAKEEKQWKACWITPKETTDNLLGKEIHINKQVVSARVYMTGVGLYELYMDGKKVGNEFLTPNFNNYEDWIQFDTYEINEFSMGKHQLQILLGNGWYKGRYVCMGPGIDHNRYGDKLAAIVEIHINYSDGTNEIIVSNEEWYSKKSNILSDSLYDGEEIDDTIVDDRQNEVEILDLGFQRLTARYSLPVVVKEEVIPKQIIYTPKNEVVLDFGQNMVGWVAFYSRLKKGQRVSYEAGEILQDDCFYNANYRSAKASFVYTSDGKNKWIRPHFTYYGFRYIKLTGFDQEIALEDFKAQVLYSDMDETGKIETGNAKVNQLISNILWGQKGNFVDNPTDCPQRDERLGWTGDAQVFSMTATYNMDTAAFFKKYMKDIYSEQINRQGAVPFIVPNICFGSNSSAAWGDAATIIPWNLYLMYGDKHLLAEQYPGMKAWVDYINSRDQISGNTRLWNVDNHFGDWLSLDDPGIGMPTGGTDLDLIATGYYYLSTMLTAKAAKELNKSKDADKYFQLADEIAQAFKNEFLTPLGKLAVGTQTAYAFTLFLGLGIKGKEQKLVDGLVLELKKNRGHLNTGFVGTPFLCQMLSKYGRNDLSYKLLLNEEFPGWLYSVNLGATTIWERWNSVLPDGHMNPEGMNSLNHYAYGSIGQWMYQYMLGIKPDEHEPGWEHFYLEPMPDRSIHYAQGYYDSCRGKIVSKWNYDEDKNIHFEFEIPYGTKATVIFHDAIISDEKYQIELDEGQYQFCFPAKSLSTRGYDKESSISELLADADARKIIERYAPELLFLPSELVKGTLEDNVNSVFSGHSKLELNPIVEELKKL